MKIDTLKLTRFYATIKHGAQLYSGIPYTHHLAAVEAVIRRFHSMFYDEHRSYDHLLHAAWLHDIVEDTGTKLKEIREIFGDSIADLVGAVTDEPGENRRVRKALTYPKIRKAGQDAVALKLADRIANVETGGNLVEMYRREHEDFRHALYHPGQNEPMWTHLDKLMEVKS